MTVGVSLKASSATPATYDLRTSLLVDRVFVSLPTGAGDARLDIVGGDTMPSSAAGYSGNVVWSTSIADVVVPSVQAGHTDYSLRLSRPLLLRPGTLVLTVSSASAVTARILMTPAHALFSPEGRCS